MLVGDHGVDPAMLYTHGYGGTQPIVNSNGEHADENMRVEFVLMDKDDVKRHATAKAAK